MSNIKKQNKLTVIKTFYGTSKIPVIQLDYHDGGQFITYDIGLNNIDIDYYNRLKYAIENNYIIEFIDN